MLLDTDKISEDAITYINHRSDGIPLFIEELTQMLLDRRYLIKENNEYRLIHNLDKKAFERGRMEILCNFEWMF